MMDVSLRASVCIRKPYHCLAFVLVHIDRAVPDDSSTLGVHKADQGRHGAAAKHFISQESRPRDVDRAPEMWSSAFAPHQGRLSLHQTITHPIQRLCSRSQRSAVVHVQTTTPDPLILVSRARSPRTAANESRMRRHVARGRRDDHPYMRQD